MSTQEHWAKLAYRWANVGSPLRPTIEDQHIFAHLLQLSNNVPRRALILGVTPELRTLPWPKNSTVKALDQSHDMIGAIWSGKSEEAIVGNWLEMPFPINSFDCAVCDGGLHLLGFPEDHQAFVNSIFSVLAPGGCLAIRLFAKPVVEETISHISQRLVRGAIGSFHEFKLRMLMALQRDPESGISVKDAYERIVECFEKSGTHLVYEKGWSPQEIETLKAYESSPSIYHFLSEEESISQFTKNGCFRELARNRGTYSMADQCPIILLQRT